MDNNELVICQGLTKNYGKKTALNNLNLTLGRGQFIGLLGPNGSGKTTTIKLLNGLLQPSEGEVLLDGKSIWDAKGKCSRETRFRVGLVFQYPEYQLFEETIAKDIAYGPTNMKLPQTEIDDGGSRPCTRACRPVSVCAVRRSEAPRSHRRRHRHAAGRTRAR